MAMYESNHKKSFRYSIKYYRWWPFHGGDASQKRYISFLCWFREAAAFGGLLWWEMTSVSSDYGRLMEVVSLRGFKFCRLWKFRHVVFSRGGGMFIYRVNLFYFLHYGHRRQWPLKEVSLYYKTSSISSPNMAYTQLNFFCFKKHSHFLMLTVNRDFTALRKVFDFCWFWLLKEVVRFCTCFRNRSYHFFLSPILSIFQKNMYKYLDIR